eukprot:6730837-Prymnesium_polylepis.1
MRNVCEALQPQRRATVRLAPPMRVDSECAHCIEIPEQAHAWRPWFRCSPDVGCTRGKPPTEPRRAYARRGLTRVDVSIRLLACNTARPEPPTMWPFARPS